MAVKFDIFFPRGIIANVPSQYSKSFIEQWSNSFRLADRSPGALCTWISALPTLTKRERSNMDPTESKKLAERIEPSVQRYAQTIDAELSGEPSLTDKHARLKRVLVKNIASLDEAVATLPED